MKKYIAKSHVAICVTFANGSHKHINFSPKSNGESVYYSDSKEEQDALESHPRFGRLYKIDETPQPVVKGPAPVVPATATENNAPSAEEAQPTLVTIPVTDLAAAKDYLCEKYGLSRTKLRSTTAIINAARENGIIFSGI